MSALGLAADLLGLFLVVTSCVGAFCIGARLAREWSRERGE